MQITVNSETIRKIVRALLLGEDHRSVVTDIIDDIYLEQAFSFLRDVATAKQELGQQIDQNWYESYFLSKNSTTQSVAWNAGLNLKTITNRRRSASRAIVLEDSLAHHRGFVSLIESISSEEDLGIAMHLTLGSAAVELDLTESLVVINALAVRRAGIRGGAWSTVGKQIEGPLMEILCQIHDVASSQYRREAIDDESLREVDFYLVSSTQGEARCEVKLMGKGNPESADAVLARGSKVFVASTLSALNKKQLDQRGVLWTELQTPNGFVRFGKTLTELEIDHIEISPDDDHSDLIDFTLKEYFRFS